MPVGIINSGRPGPRVVISAGIHGSEYPGIEAANRLWRSLTADTINGVVVMFPLVNVPGFEAAEANVNPLDHINLNRIFPGDPNGSPSMVMANRLVEEVSQVADYVLDLHGGDTTEWLDPFAIWFRSGNEEVDRKSHRLAELYDTKHIWITSGNTGTPAPSRASTRAAPSPASFARPGSWAPTAKRRSPSTCAPSPTFSRTSARWKGNRSASTSSWRESSRRISRSPRRAVVRCTQRSSPARSSPRVKCLRKSRILKV